MDDGIDEGIVEGDDEDIVTGQQKMARPQTAKLAGTLHSHCIEYFIQ